METSKVSKGPMIFFGAGFRIVVLQAVPLSAEATAPGMMMVAMSQPSRSRPLLLLALWYFLTRLEEPSGAMAILLACFALSFVFVIVRARLQMLNDPERVAML